MGLEAIKRILFTPASDQLDNAGALKADAGGADKKKFNQELIAAAYNGANGYVSPPASNIMGFGPAANQDVS